MVSAIPCRKWVPLEQTYRHSSRAADGSRRSHPAAVAAGLLRSPIRPAYAHSHNGKHGACASAVVDSYTRANPHPVAFADHCPDANGYSYPHINRHAHSDANADHCSDANGYSYPHANRHARSDANADIHPDANSHPVAFADHYPDADVHADYHAHAVRRGVGRVLRFTGPPDQPAVDHHCSDVYRSVVRLQRSAWPRGILALEMQLWLIKRLGERGWRSMSTGATNSFPSARRLSTPATCPE